MWTSFRESHSQGLSQSSPGFGHSPNDHCTGRFKRWILDSASHCPAITSTNYVKKDHTCCIASILFPYLFSVRLSPYHSLLPVRLTSLEEESRIVGIGCKGNTEDVLVVDGLSTDLSSFRLCCGSGNDVANWLSSEDGRISLCTGWRHWSQIFKDRERSAGSYWAIKSHFVPCDWHFLSKLLDTTIWLYNRYVQTQHNYILSKVRTYFLKLISYFIKYRYLYFTK